jgi:5-methyltetrahydrofolate--homocysteine methyltransferase
MMLEGGGFDVIDLGTDVSPGIFVEAIRKDKADIVGLSALLTTTMPQMEATIKAIREAGIRDMVKIIVGGAPVTPEYAEKIGADGFAPDASQAVRLAKNLAK